MTDQPAGEAMVAAIIRCQCICGWQGTSTELQGRVGSPVFHCPRCGAGFASWPNPEPAQAGKVVYPGFIGLLTEFFFRAKCGDSETWRSSLDHHERQDAPLFKQCRVLAVEADGRMRQSFTPDHQEWLAKPLRANRGE